MKSSSSPPRPRLAHTSAAVVPCSAAASWNAACWCSGLSCARMLRAVGSSGSLGGGGGSLAPPMGAAAPMFSAISGKVASDLEVLKAFSRAAAPGDPLAGPLALAAAWGAAGASGCGGVFTKLGSDRTDRTWAPCSLPLGCFVCLRQYALSSTSGNPSLPRTSMSSPAALAHIGWKACVQNPCEHWMQAPFLLLHTEHTSLYRGLPTLGRPCTGSIASVSSGLMNVSGIHWLQKRCTQA
mmetsp:Transcript_10058/g.28253  ORF Transcript_10058/g.28253 Transcript_10058/m.28253 type:complete len:239 (+) Transcript_10058:413-1129(+)